MTQLSKKAVEELLKQFLPSVIANSSEATVYVIDNASTDNSVSLLKTQFSTVNVIINTANGGYAKGYNEGLSKINADVLCL